MAAVRILCLYLGFVLIINESLEPGRDVKFCMGIDNKHVTYVDRSRGSSVSIVSDYGLDDRAIEVRSPTGAEDFSSSPCVQTGSEAHSASYPMGTGDPFLGGKARPGRDADHSPPSSSRG
jgi:hypothetical protein